MPLKPYNGTSFVEANELKVWNGSSWVTSSTARVWNGSSWVIFHRGGAANFTGGTFITGGLSDSQSSPGDYANVKYQINADGYVYVDQQYGGLNSYEQWCTPAGFASNFEVYATLDYSSTNGVADSPYVAGGTFGSWLDLSTTHNWEKIIYENGANQNAQAQITFQVRKKNSTTVLDTWTIIMAVELTELNPI